MRFTDSRRRDALIDHLDIGIAVQNIQNQGALTRPSLDRQSNPRLNVFSPSAAVHSRGGDPDNPIGLLGMRQSIIGGHGNGVPALHGSKF